MGIDRETLSRIDRKLLAELDNDERWRVIRLPASDALWSAWKRYCSAIGISMGRGLRALIQRELEAVIGTASDVDRLKTTEAELSNRNVALDQRERLLAEREEAVMKCEHLLSMSGQPLASSGPKKVGRNDRCPCGSGLKSKRCHGSPT
jgi:hypothetical protein